ncbi:hypothetical protein [Paenibacillus odorifer]|uniref:hypothetical protein n=1 Tax=Paenibacillus odorifer TaxID=189426 RepID=UPI000BA1414A|nr:hypothetical protein [Paenibacillus odorifer]OZQ68285.1 hypothetical protein CA596_25795 [Paenibacillus odorifer]
MANVHIIEGAKGRFISFYSPFLKNKKGHARQINKGIGKIKDQKVIDKIVLDIESILSNTDYLESYEGYLMAKSKFEEFAVDAVFVNSIFDTKHHSEAIYKILESRIPLKEDEVMFKDPAVVFIGLPGGGKSTTIKQIIGASESSFPAIMQSNTTVGLLEIHANQGSKSLDAVAICFSRVVLEELLKSNLLNVIRMVLSYLNDNFTFEKGIFNQETIKSLYTAVTQSSDRKTKLQYVLNRESFDNIDFFNNAVRSAIEIWEGFKGKVKKGEYENLPKVDEVYTRNNGTVFYNSFDEYVAGDNSHELFDDLIDKIFDLIKNNVRQILAEMIHFSLNSFDDIDIDIEVVDTQILKIDNSKVLDIDGMLSDIEIPKYIVIRIKYQDKREPDEKLRKYYFELMEYISSASESKIGHTLFPLIERVRISGNFKPSWQDTTAKNYILIDSEGFGHDIANKVISNELRGILNESGRIAFIQNGSQSISSDAKEIVSELITSGAIYKTTFCFNRLERFDSKSSALLESKLNYINMGIKNLLAALVKDEENQEDKIVTGNEPIFERMIMEKTLLFEYLEKTFDNKEGFIPEESLSKYNSFKNKYEKYLSIDEEIANDMKNSMMDLFVKFDSGFNTVTNIEKLIQGFNISEKKLPSYYENLNFKLNYDTDNFSHTSAEINKSFHDEFILLIREGIWQTIKAFNERIAGNYGSREWREFRPESHLTGIIQRRIFAYLMHPENLFSEKDIKDRGIFVEFIIQMTQNHLVKAFRQIAEDHINAEILKEKWRLAASKHGPGSTFERKEIIIQAIDDYFTLNYNSGKRDPLIKDLRRHVFDNPYMKTAKVNYV